ncbi:MAG: ATP-dependent DNA helicase [Akkermansia sp.]|nr:ATP-dependent DNA helicase [Akkermansia sp.]
MGVLSEQTLLDFSETGLLSHARGFEFRPEQQQMAVAVAETLEGESALLAEAGTGVGKSLAYLIPAIRFALENGRKAVISTHTINLQEQLFHKDIPTVARALNCHFDAALLKGRANYLCRTRLRRALEQADDLFNQAETKQLYDLLAWSKDCGEGSLAELPHELNISPKVWAQVCSENHVCTPRNCGYDCPYQAARRRVQEAQVVVLNHTLFFGLLSLADEMMTVEPEGPPGFIFPNDFVILDEAHTIENVAANQLGLSLSEAEMKYELLRLYNPHTHKGSMRHNASPTLLQLIEEAQAAVGEFFTAARADCQLEAHHGTVRLRQPEWTENLLSPVLRQLFAELKDMASMEENDLTKAELLDTAARILAYDEAATEMVKLTNAATTVYWVESHGLEGQFTTMRGALINVAPVLREKLFEAGRSCICTSATLSTGERGMGYFAGRVGAESARPLQIGSPFDFEKQMRIIVARSMPPPPPASEDDEYLPALADWIMRSLDESQGRAFVLFTSYKLLSAMAVRLRPFCQERGWPLLVQGDELNRSQMVHSFRENIGSVLLGTDSFWTGVDVPGEALSNVIVTKIPFESPGNPLVEARIEDITARGGNAFRDYSLPEAVLKFRQGIGRLIRSKTDTGIVTILDSRVTNKFYGARFMYALPATAPREFL